MNFTKLLSQKNSDILSSSPIRMAFLGDSVTHGAFEIYENGCVYDYDAVYHSRLVKKINMIFPSVPINILNAGISGNDAVQGLERIERDVLPFSPDIAVVCFGLNDVGGGIEKINCYGNALKGIFTKLKEKNIETIFMTPNMMNTYVSPNTHYAYKEIAGNMAELQSNGIMDAYMECAMEASRNEKIPVCDCYRIWKHMYKMGADTTALLSNYINHPTREMHSIFSASLFDMIMCENNLQTISR